MSQFDHADVLSEKFINDRMLGTAREMLCDEELTEEAFLGAQGVLLLHGLI